MRFVCACEKLVEVHSCNLNNNNRRVIKKIIDNKEENCISFLFYYYYLLRTFLVVVLPAQDGIAALGRVAQPGQVDL